MRFTIKLKLAIAFGFLILTLVGTAGYGVFSLANSKAGMDEVIDGTVARLDRMQQLNAISLATVRAQKNMILATTPQELQTFIEASNESRAEFRQIFEEMASTASAATRDFWQELRSNVDKFEASDSRIQELVRNGNTAAATQSSSNEGRDAANALTKKLEEGVQINRDRLQQAKATTDSDYATTRTLLIAISVIATLVAAITALWIALGISAGLRKIMAVAEAVAIGDLDQNVEMKTNDEIKDLVDTINRMTSNLKEMATVAEKIAEGDLMVTPKPQSDKDTLGLALASMVERLRGVVADALSASDNVSSGSQELSASS
ncbi:MCP four helix bundle domain-containing protein, partial [Ciceribacter selenitireducens]|uniref:MCP four helix bundle domain-containing protein n=1 Tax=Ciceribacter selenitireducens TaxID=448181 RepID=UPI0005627818